MHKLMHKQAFGAVNKDTYFRRFLINVNNMLAHCSVLANFQLVANKQLYKTFISFSVITQEKMAIGILFVPHPKRTLS